MFSTGSSIWRIPNRSVFFALLFGCVIPAMAQWEQVSSGTTSSLKDIFFVNDTIGFCVGGGNASGLPNQEQAVILRSTDGGETWSTAFQDSLVSFHRVAASGDTVVCFGRSLSVTGLLWSSFDNGNTWTLDTLAWLGGNTSNVSFFGSDLLILTGQDLLRLDLSTHLAETLFVANGAGLFDVDRNWIYVVHMDKTLFRSTDGGLNWDTIPCILSDPGPWTWSYLETVFATGDTVFVKVTYTDEIAYTTDLGLNWNWYPAGVGPHVAVASLDTIYGYLNDGLLAVSIDRGASSQLQQTLTSTIRKIFFLRGTQHGWVCGDDGMIYKTYNGGFLTGLNDAEREDEVPILAHPDPATDRVALVVPVDLQVVSISLLDSLARKTRVFQPDDRSLNVQGLVPGQYILLVTTERGVESIKVNLK